MIRTFDTPEPVDLFVEIHNGDITVRASDTRTTTIEVVGDETDIRVEHDGSAVRVIGPKVSGLGFFRRTVGATIRATVPATSSAVIRPAISSPRVAPVRSLSSPVLATCPSRRMPSRSRRRPAPATSRSPAPTSHARSKRAPATSSSTARPRTSTWGPALAM